MLAGGCQRRGGQEPYAPLLQALERHLHHRSPTQVRADVQGCAWLARLLPELAAAPIEPLPAWTLSPEQERRLMFGAVARFLGNVAGSAGTLLLLDDLQWAGSDALDLLATLVRSSEVPLRVVGAYRDTEVQRQDPLSVMVADLAHARLAIQHTLAPLAPDEVGQLLDALLEDVEGDRTALRERVLQRTGGVPFFVVSCAQGLRPGTGDGGGEDAVPWDVVQSVRQRLTALPEIAQEVLSTAAVAGRVVRAGLLMAVAGHAEREVAAALKAACRARLLLEVEDPRAGQGYQFAHDVIREVVEADLGVTQRMFLHRRIAAALERAPGELPLDLLAYHYSRSEEQDKALLYLERAGDHAAAQAAHAAAEGYYRELVERLAHLRRDLDAARAREKLGAVLRTAARYGTALTVLEQAAETYHKAGDLESLGRAMAQIGQVHAARGTAEEGLERLQPLLERLDAGGVPTLAALYIALARLFFLSGRYPEQLAAAEHAVALARAVEDDTTRAEAVWQHGLALLCVGRVEDGLRVTEEASRLAEAAGDLFSLAHALNLLTIAYGNRGEVDEGMRYSARALAVAEQLGDPALIVFMACNRGAVAFDTGDWSQARVHLERATALSRQTGRFQHSTSPLVALGRLCLAEGDWDAASCYLEEALATAEHHDNLAAQLDAQTALAERDLWEGHPEAARARLVPLLDHLDLAGEWASAPLSWLAWAHLELGNVDQASEVAAQAVTRAQDWHNQIAVVDALRIHAMVVTRQQRWTDAARLLEEALSLARRIVLPYAEARLLHVYGQTHAQKGEPGPARARLEAALAIFRRLGARKDAERVEQDLAALPLPER